METILVLILVAISLLYLFKLQFKQRQLPPGPVVLPVLGNLLTMIKLRSPGEKLSTIKAWEVFHKMYQRYGEIFSFTTGNFSSVVICSHEILNEIANIDEYSWKVSTEFTKMRTFGKEKGLIFVSNNDIWMEMRKFSQRTLRDFGFGKRESMHGVISAEIGDLVSDLKNKIANSEDGKTTEVKVHTFFMLSVLNVLWCMIAGKRYRHDDPKLVAMMERNLAMTKQAVFAAPLKLGFSFLYKWFPKFFGLDFQLKVFRECHQFSKSLVEERKEEGFYMSGPENYIDCFLRKIEQKRGPDVQSQGNQQEDIVYNDEQLQAMIEDFLQTGSTTTNGTLNYAVLYLALNPHVQKRCHEEIDTFVGEGLVPTLEDIEKMPYFQAMILEVHRIANIVPNPVPRLLLKDWDYKGYRIPKGTRIISNHYTIQMDEAYWGDPHVFRPERFIDANGGFAPDKHVVQFGFGKRYCIGVTLANSVIPIYISTLLQNFNLNLVPGESRPSVEPEVGVSLSPLPFSVQVSLRKTKL